MSEVGESTHDSGSPGLERLQQRLDALQNSVERLGTEQWMPSAPPASPVSGYALPVPPYAPAPVYGDPDPNALAPAYVPIPIAPPPAAVVPPPGVSVPPSPNGQTEPPPIALPVAVITVGPFSDLIDLRHFEEALSGLDAVNEVHVRRFGVGWAEVEVGLTADYPIAGELQRLGRPMRFESDPSGRLIVEFTDVSPGAEGGTEAAAPQGEVPASAAADGDS